jgi:hypothetical protein
MTSIASGNGQAFDAEVHTEDGNTPTSIPGPGVYSPALHAQLKALAEHAEMSIGLAEQQIAHLQEALEGRRKHAEEQAAELRRYEDLHDVHDVPEAKE